MAFQVTTSFVGTSSNSWRAVCNFPARNRAPILRLFEYTCLVEKRLTKMGLRRDDEIHLKLLG